jgi:plasmid stabilization system protein ParE
MSARRIEFHESAVADVKSAVAWYRERSTKAAQDFVDEVKRATETIRESPTDGRRVRTSHDGFFYGDFRSQSSTPSLKQ